MPNLALEWLEHVTNDFEDWIRQIPTVILVHWEVVVAEWIL